MSNEGLVFDETNHEYYYNGNPVPSVTHIITDIGLVKFWGTQYHLTKGSMLHKAVKLFFEGRLANAGSFAHEINQLSLFVDQYKLRPVMVEKALYSVKYRYAGTPDVVVRDRDDTVWLIDVKSGKSSKSYPIQLGGYAVLVNENAGLEIGRLGVLFLRDNGFEFREVNPVEAVRDWMVCLAFYNLKQKGAGNGYR